MRYSTKSQTLKTRKCESENCLEKRKFEVLIEDSNDVFEIINPNGVIQYISPAVEKITGRKPEERIGKYAFEFAPPKEKAKLLKVLNLILEEVNKTIKTTILYKTNENKEIFLEVTAKNQLHECSINGIVLNWRDVTQQIENRKKIVRISTYDKLTNLPNREYFIKHLNNYCNDAKEKNTSFALMVIGVDGFKYINDSLGYKVGDEILIKIAERLKYFLDRVKGHVYRYSGDQFMAIIPNLDSMEEYENIAQDIISLFTKSFKIDIYDLDMTISLGATICPTDSYEIDILKTHVLMSLARAKDEGRNRYAFYSPTMNVENYKEFILRNDLKKAIDKNQFLLHYQPQVNLNNSNIIAAEALIRWNHPVWGIVAPKEFIPLADETGFIIELGNWVLKEVCRTYKKWIKNKLPKIKISVNYSSVQFFEKNFIENIQNTLDEFQLDPSFLIIEITENILSNHTEKIISHIEDLQKMGIQIALDDFGTGFSSLAYLYRLNIDIFKIDRSFISNIPSDKVSSKITETIINLGRDLKIKLVAEGIENWEQLSHLKLLNCYTGQGYIYSEPLPLQDFEKILYKGKCKPITINDSPIKPFEQRRKFFRVKFPYLLEADMTILELNGKKVQVGNTKVLIKNIGPGGLSFISNINFPIRKDIVLKFKTELLGEEVISFGCPVWTGKLEYDLHEYGIEFNFDENDRSNLTRILNTFQVKLRNNPEFSHGSFTTYSYISYFKGNIQN